MSDEAIREQALDIRHSFIVQAPAGSGKTTLLINRYLSLLAKAPTPESVVVMTFTNKAVEELQARVTQLLHQVSTLSNNNQNNSQNDSQDAHSTQQQQTYQLAQAVLNQSLKLNWQLLQYPRRLKITTIDALCRTLVQNHSPIDNLIPSQIIADKVVLESLYAQSITEVLALIEDPDYQEDITTVLAHLDNNTKRFIELFMSMLKKREQWLRHISLKQNLKHTKQQIISGHLNALVAPLTTLASFLDLVAISPKIPPQSQIFFASLTSTTTEVEALEHFVVLADTCLTKTGTLRQKSLLGFTKKDHSQAQLALADINLAQYPAFLKLLHQCRNLPDIADDKDGITTAIITSLKLCVAQLMLNFSKVAAVDFNEIALQSIALLSSQEAPSPASLYLDKTLNHLLVDEFQDTSYTQFELLKALTQSWQTGDGKTLFLVGDPMQSIYRFREAEVGLFLQVQRNGISHIKPKTLKLSQNFRSNIAIVEQNNHCFNHIFPQENNISLGEVCHAASTSGISQPPIDNATNFYGFADYNPQAEAQQICQIIDNEKRDNPKQSIAILVRARSHLPHIMAALVQNNIDFEAVDIHPLAENAHIKDLLCLVCALNHLGDKLAWLSVLHAPWCGLQLADLLLLSDTNYLTIWQAIEHHLRAQSLSKDGLKRLGNFYQVLAPIIAQSQQFSLDQVIAVILQQLSVNDYLSPNDQQAQATFLNLVATLSAQHQVLDRQSLHERLLSLYEKSQQNASVKLMTIFAAKGLEFDCVILPSLGRKPPNPASELLPFIELKQGLLYAPIKPNTASKQSQTYEYIKQQKKTQNQHELMRILYVAMTRARSKNYLLGHKKVAHTQPEPNSLLSLLWSYYNDEFGQNTPPVPSPDSTKKTPPKLSRQPAVVAPEYPVPQPDSTSSQTLTPLSGQLPVQAVGIGVLVHRYLQYHKLAKPLIPRTNIIKQQLKSQGVSVQYLSTSSQQIKQLLTQLQQADFYTWLFTERPSTQVEKKFFQISQGHISKTIVVDRLFIDNGIVWIIDYKTQAPPLGQTQSDFLSEQKNTYQRQLKTYSNIVAKYYKHPIKTALCLLAIPYLLEIT